MPVTKRQLKKVAITLQNFCQANDEPQRLLQAAGLEVKLNTLGRRVRKDELVKFLEGADAVVAGVEPYSNEVLSQLPNLKLISRCGSGTDAIDLEAARRLGIKILTTPDETIEPVAQMAVAMVLALARNLCGHYADFQKGKWIKRYGALLSEWTIGIVGFGRIGSRVATYLKPFGPKILVADPCLKVMADMGAVEFCDFKDLLQRSDCVTLHAGRGPEEGVLMGANQFSLMRQGSYLINTSRGYLVDEGALCEALTSGRLAGAGLDVYEKEPYAGPLSKVESVICTPHVSTLTKASRVAMEVRSIKNIVNFYQSVNV